MINCWVKIEALIERKDVSFSVELVTEYWWIHCVVVKSEVVRTDRNLLHLTVLINRH